MIQYSLKIEGMACTMCEAHIKEAILKAAPGAKKLSASHRKGDASFVASSPAEEAALKTHIEAGGYRLVSISQAPYEKKGLFGRR